MWTPGRRVRHGPQLGAAGVIQPRASHTRMTPYHRMGAAMGALLRGFRSLTVGNRALGEAMLQATLDGRRDDVIENR